MSTHLAYPHKSIRPAFLLSTPPLIAIIFALASCATVPEQKIVTSVQSLPPVQVPLPVRCVKPIGGCVGAKPEDKCQEIPPIPPNTVDPNATPLQRYFQMKADLLALDAYKIRANAAILGCAAEEAPK